MLHKCANPACTAVFRYLREGKLFYVETEAYALVNSGHPDRKKAARRLEHYWLCDACAGQVTLAFDQQKGVLTVPLADCVVKKAVREVAPQRIPA